MKLAMILIAVIGISITGCKKDNSTTTSTSNDDTSTLQQLSKDDNQVQKTEDDALDDVNSYASRGESKSIEALPCNVTISDSSSTLDSTKITLTFSGNNCAGTKTRTGQIQYSKKISEHWKDAGTSIVIKFINYKVTKIATNKSITINGTKTFQNVSGGLIKNLGNSLTSVIHKITGTIQVTFDDNTTRTWSIARQRTITGNFPLELVLTVEGFGNSNGHDSLVTWGTNRNGEDFYTQITNPVVFKEVCNGNPVSGTIIYQIPSDNKKATVTFGYDAQNNPITTGDCPAKYKLVWEKNGHTGTIYISLP